MVKYFNKKCPQCGLQNYADTPITACSACRAPLMTVAADGSSATGNLEPCEDCRIPISKQAEACPYCGRFYRDLRPHDPPRGTRWWVFTIALAVAFVAFIYFWIFAALSYFFSEG